jgi:hypothetical protein
MYHLSGHAFVCMTGRYYVFLDLVRDAYLSIPREDLDELAPWIDEWPLDPRRKLPVKTRSSEAATALAAELMAAGVLCAGPFEPRAAARIAPPAVSDLASIPQSLHPVRGPCHAFANIGASLLSANLSLRFIPIYLIVNAIGRRKRTLPMIDRTQRDRATHFTRVFLNYRPMFPWNYRCIFDSLALIRFLSRFNVHPDWVFGVRDDPFNAHCWVQAGTQVLNDDLEHVRNYTPIMTV